MKKNSESKKLVLNKVTIQDLDDRQLNSVKGGTGAISLTACPTTTTTVTGKDTNCDPEG